MKTAGVVFDFYDDPNGELLKRAFPTEGALPELVKKAHILSPEERDILRDEAYALVMVNEGAVLRKFACVDAGNTLLSALYFLETRHQLPEEAQKVASQNILRECRRYELPLDEMVLEAAGVEKTAAEKRSTGKRHRERDPMKSPLVGDEADWAQRTNMTSIQGSTDSGRVMDSAGQMKQAALISVHIHKGGPETKRVVDVSKHNPIKPEVKAKTASRTALEGEYALDSWSDAQKAVNYFCDNYLSFDPAARHEYAVKTAARADELGMDVPELVSRYGSLEYAPDLDAHLAYRKQMAPEHVGLYTELQEKRASIDPEKFAELLAEVDQVSGLDFLYPQVSDPYFATFGGYTKKEKLASWKWESASGDAVTAQSLASIPTDTMARHFDDSIVNAFQSAPVEIFESLPDTHKLIIARMANED